MFYSMYNNCKKTWRRGMLVGFLKMAHLKIERDVILFSLFTRCAFLFVSVISRHILPKHDPQVFVAPIAIYSTNLTVYDGIVTFFLGGLTNWDAQHFYHISQNGYIFEQSLAFFPLYPAAVSVLSKLISLFIGEALNEYSKLILVSFCLNVVCFTIAALVLFRLSCVVLKNNLIALQSTFLFCISPASIFFLASYSETLFSLLVFSGMLKYTRGHLFQSAVFFSLASACRSNGIMNVGFILHYILYVFTFAFESKQALRINVVPDMMKLVIKAVLYTSLILCPYFLFQLFGYYIFCVEKSFFDVPSTLNTFGMDKGYKLVTDKIAWCENTVPLPYSYVQSEYWNVGFLKYYNVRQIPNFLLALPITIVIVPYSIIFLKRYCNLLFEIKYIYNPNLKLNSKTRTTTDLFTILPRSTFVFTVHAFVLIVFCILNINVQVTTRIICSSSPLLYWISALHFKRVNKSSKIQKNFFSPIVAVLKPVGQIGSFLRLYYLSYAFIGVVMFSCDLPWT